MVHGTGMGSAAPGPFEARIAERLRAALGPEVVQVVDESGMHAAPRGGGSHLKVLVVASAFAGVPLVQRHRQVNDALAEEFASGLHALSIAAHTPEEWEARGRKALDSPPCRGGSGHG